MTQNIMVHRHNKWRLLIRNRRFRFEVNQLLQQYSEWVNGPPLGVVIDEDDDFYEGELDRADVLFSEYRIMEHDDDPFIRAWRRISAKWRVTLPKQILSDNFPLLDICNIAPEWEALDECDTIFPPAVVPLNGDFNSIDQGYIGFQVNPNDYPKNMLFAEIGKKITTRSTRDSNNKLPDQLRVYDAKIAGRTLDEIADEEGKSESTIKSMLLAANDAIGNERPQLRAWTKQDRESWIENPEFPQACEDEQRDIRDALSQLPPEEREIAFAYMEGVSISEYAKRTRQSEAETKNAWESCQRKLQILLRDWKNEESRFPELDYCTFDFENSPALNRLRV